MAQQEQKKPNILVTMADDIAIWNISAYHRGMMGGRTPNIDRIAREGALFTDYYSQQSCTAGRASFITGQHPFRTVGELLKKLDDLSVADNTMVLFTSDNGAEVMSWPDGGNTPFKGEGHHLGRRHAGARPRPSWISSQA
jgi:arylsulfatase A-like enzyme